MNRGANGLVLRPGLGLFGVGHNLAQSPTVKDITPQAAVFPHAVQRVRQLRMLKAI